MARIRDLAGQYVALLKKIREASHVQALLVFVNSPGGTFSPFRYSSVRALMTKPTPAASLLRNLLRTADFLPFAYGLGLAAVLMRRIVATGVIAVIDKCAPEFTVGVVAILQPFVAMVLLAVEVAAIQPAGVPDRRSWSRSTSRPPLKP